MHGRVTWRASARPEAVWRWVLNASVLLCVDASIYVEVLWKSHDMAVQGPISKAAPLLRKLGPIGLSEL
eukprot:4662501-Amphidinium_carterae.1